MSSEAGRFGDLLRLHRVGAGLSQDQLAERAGLSRRAITALESGARRWPYPDTARRLAEALRLEGNDRARLLSCIEGRRGSSLKRRTATLVANAHMSVTSFVGRTRELQELSDEARDGH